MAFERRVVPVVETATHGDKGGASMPENTWTAKLARSAGVGLPYVITFYVLEMEAARQATSVQTGISLWYAPIGLTIAVLLRFGLGYAPLYFVVAVFGKFIIWR